jgi:mercuric ion binding protein
MNMKRIATILTVSVALGIGSVVALTTLSLAQYADAGAAVERTATLNVENMYCALCPIAVSKAMEGVAGVKGVSVSFEDKTATVIFDPAVTTPEEIALASTNIGYPAQLAGN